jgi:hypothetical protein
MLGEARALAPVSALPTRLSECLPPYGTSKLDSNNNSCSILHDIAATGVGVSRISNNTIFGINNRKSLKFYRFFFSIIILKKNPKKGADIERGCEKM